MKCWRCGQPLTNGENTCRSCGTVQERIPVKTGIGRTLRTIYDLYGAKEVLTRSDYIVNGLGSGTKEENEARRLFKLALDAGVGTLYLDRLQTKGYTDMDFKVGVFLYLAEDAGLREAPTHLITWFDEMIGWKELEAEPKRASYKRSPRFLCIDLGGTTSRAAVMEGGRATLVPNPNGGFGRPCAVGVRNGRLLVCEQALRQAITHPDETVQFFKTQMGTETNIPLGAGEYSPQFLSALVIRKLRADAAAYLGEDPVRAIITVPTSYTNRQRQAAIAAGRMAGLTVERVISNTAAAAMHICARPLPVCYALICCMGSTSFDVSVVNMQGQDIVEVVTSGGSTRLGGRDFTDRIARWIRDSLKSDENFDLSGDPIVVARVWEAAETAKKELSGHMSTQVFIPSITFREGQPLHFDRTLTRAEFNEMTAPLREEAGELVQSALRDAEGLAGKIERLFFVGGGSRMPAMRDTVRQILGMDIDPVVQPDECVALGAAIQSGILTGDVTDELLLDATVHSVGIETPGDVFTEMIHRNSTIPIRAAQTFSTSADNQITIDIHVLEGESEKASTNETLGRYRITDIPPAAKGEARIDVSFLIDANGRIHISAKDTGTDTMRPVTTLNAGAISEEQIQKGAEMVEQIAAEWET